MRSRKLSPALDQAAKVVAKGASSTSISADVQAAVEAVEAGVRVCEMILGDAALGVDDVPEVATARQALRDAVAEARDQVSALRDLAKQAAAAAKPPPRKPRPSDNIPVLAAVADDDEFEDDYEISDDDDDDELYGDTAYDDEFGTCLLYTSPSPRDRG